MYQPIPFNPMRRFKEDLSKYSKILSIIMIVFVLERILYISFEMIFPYSSGNSALYSSIYAFSIISYIIRLVLCVFSFIFASRFLRLAKFDPRMTRISKNTGIFIMVGYGLQLPLYSASSIFTLSSIGSYSFFLQIISNISLFIGFLYLGKTFQELESLKILKLNSRNILIYSPAADFLVSIMYAISSFFSISLLGSGWLAIYSSELALTLISSIIYIVGMRRINDLSRFIDSQPYEGVLPPAPVTYTAQPVTYTPQQPTYQQPTYQQPIQSQSQSSTVAYCEYCGQKLAAEDRFCSGCGRETQ